MIISLAQLTEPAQCAQCTVTASSLTLPNDGPPFLQNLTRHFLEVFKWLEGGTIEGRRDTFRKPVCVLLVV